jgi:hypothetical protein
MCHEMPRTAGSFGADGFGSYGPAANPRLTGGHVSATRTSPPAETARPVMDAITVFGYAGGWALIVVGLLLLGLALTN